MEYIEYISFIKTREKKRNIRKFLESSLIINQAKDTKIL